MPSPPEDELSRALLHSLKDGTYPDSEAIVSAEFPVSALSAELQFIRDAREEVKNDIRRLSRESAPDVDGWISQARQLHADIESSKTTARAVIRGHETVQALRSKVDDASAKWELLKGEINFNDALVGTLGKLQDINNRFAESKSVLARDRVLEAISQLDEIQRSTSGLGPLKRGFVVRIFQDRATELRKDIEECIQRSWASLVTVDRPGRKITITNHVSDTTSIDLDTAICAFEKLGILSSKIDALSQDVEDSLLTPLLIPTPSGHHPCVSVEGGCIKISEEIKSGLGDLFGGIISMTQSLNTLLPSRIAAPLTDTLMPKVIFKLTSSLLSQSLPINVSDMEQFQAKIALAQNFADIIDSFGWKGKPELVAWIEDMPRTWLAKRRESSLDSVRRLLSSQEKRTKQVERVEKETVSRKDDVFAGNTGGDEWDAGWSNEEEDEMPQAQSSSIDADEEDVSAWGLDDEPEHQNGSTQPQHTEGDGDAGYAWGWGDEGDVSDTESRVAVKPAKAATPQVENGLTANPTPHEQEYVLKETYHITEIPDSLLELILAQIRDAEALSHVGKSNLKISPAAGGLQSLPTLILAMFRATAPSLYAYRNGSSNMYLYNDCMYLSEKLRASHAQATPKLEQDIGALERFGKLAYGKEMESQRTIIGDLLDGAQGFTNSSEYPFSSECETAVSSVVDWMRTIYVEWKGILSHSALLQSMGSLLSTVINKMIVDIEDMNDISEPESERLASFCAQLSQLEDLFTPEQSEAGDTSTHETVPLTALYTPHWLKFQYLSNILESSLADIKYLWTDGELQLEFTSEEVTDLIESLFADSDHRRRAIDEIRRSSRGH